MTLSRRRRPFDETLLDGRSVYEAVRRLTRGDANAGSGRLGGPSISGDESIVSVADLPMAPLTRDAPILPPEPVPLNFPRPDVPVDESSPPPPSALPPLPRDLLPSTNLTASDYYSQNHAVRPKIDPDVRDPMSDYERNLIAYQPQKESKKKIALRTALGFLFGGIPGAVGTLGGELLDRRGHDRNWQQNELARVGKVQDQIGDRRRSGLQEGLIRSQIGENEAQAERARREPLQREPGYTLGEGQVRYDAKGNVISTGPAKQAAERQGLVRTRKNADGTESTLISRDNGRTWEAVDDLTSAAPPEKADTSGFTNDQLTKAIAEAQSERDLIDERLKTTPKTIPTNTLGVEAPNPEYHQLEERSRKLHSDILDWKTKMKAPTLTRGGASKPARDGRFHYTPAQIRAKAEASGVSYDALLNTLKGNKQVVIDQ